MKKLSWFVASLALSLGVSLSAAESPLEQISKDADVVVRIKAFTSTVEHVAALANAVQPGMGDLVSQNSTAFGLALSNPAMAGVDQSKDFYLFLFVREEGEPKALFAIPTTDGPALQAALPKNFVSEVREGWVYYADKDHGVPEAVSASDSLAAILKDSDALDVLDESDIGIHVNVEHIAEVYDAKIQEGRKKLEENLEKGLNTPGVTNAAGTVDILRKESEIAFQVLEDTDTMTIGLTASADGLVIDDFIAFEEGSEVAKFLDSHPKSAFKALSRLESDLPLYIGMSGDLKKVAKLGQEIVGSMYSEESMKQALEDYIAVMEKSEIGSTVVSMNLLSGNNGLFQATTVIETKSAADLMAGGRKIAEAMKSITFGGMTQETSIQPEAETIGTRKVDVMTVKQVLDASQPGAEMQKKMTGIMFGPDGMQTRMTALADGFLQTQGGGKEGMEAALKSYDANTTSLSDAREGLADEANLLVLLDLTGMVKNGLLAATGIPGIPLPFQKSAIEGLDLPQSYIGSTTVSEDDSLRIHTSIPTEQFQGVMKLVQFFQGQQRR